MQFTDIRKRHETVRSGTTVIGSARFLWVAPTEGEFRRYANTAQASASGVGRESVVRGLTGWENVKVIDLLPEYENAEERLEFTRECAAALLDVRLDWLDVLIIDVLKKYDERKEVIAQEVKKRASVSNGKSASAEQVNS